MFSLYRLLRLLFDGCITRSTTLKEITQIDDSDCSLLDFEEGGCIFLRNADIHFQCYKCQRHKTTVWTLAALRAWKLTTLIKSNYFLDGVVTTIFESSWHNLEKIPNISSKYSFRCQLHLRLELLYHIECISWNIGNHDRSVGMENRLRTGWQRNGGSIPGRECRYFCSPQRPIQYLPRPISPGLERGTHHSSPSNSEVKNLWSYSFITPHMPLGYDVN
jgi:hypothetical protein